MSQPKIAKLETFEPSRFPWLGLFLFISTASLFFQIFPGAWWGLMGILGTVWWTFLAIVDVRNWTWKVYATLFAVSIFVLVGVKAWREQ